MSQATDAPIALKELHAVIQMHRTNLIEDAKSVIQKVVQPLFDRHPEIDGIRWSRSYLGVEYRMSSTVASEKANDISGFIESGYDRQASGWIAPWNDTRIQNEDLLNSLTKFEEHLVDNDTALNDAFGDVLITVTRQGVTIEEAPIYND